MQNNLKKKLHRKKMW